jgi:hypothetical protein
METYTIKPSTNASKKFDVMQLNKKIVSFGSKGYSDYTKPTENNEQKKLNYIKRHSVNENWNDLTKAGTWARYMLWNKPTLHDSAKDMKKRFKIKIQITKK